MQTNKKERWVVCYPLKPHPESWGDKQTLEAAPPVVSLASDHRVKGGGINILQTETEAQRG